MDDRVASALSTKTFLAIWAASLIAVVLLLYARGDLGLPAAGAAGAGAERPRRAAKVKQPPPLTASLQAQIAPDAVSRKHVPLDLSPLPGRPLEVVALAKMRPGAAAGILGLLTEEDATTLLTKLNGREASLILECLAPEVAARLLAPLFAATREAQASAAAAAAAGEGVTAAEAEAAPAEEAAPAPPGG